MSCQTSAAGTSGRASHEDCVYVHTLLKDTLKDQAAAEQWYSRCQGVFCWSQYFGGTKRVQVLTEARANGLEHKVSDLSLNGHR